MATFHTVNKSPFASQTLISCLGHAKDGDTVLLIEDGVYGGAQGTGVAAVVAARAGAVSIHVLAADLAARGIDTQKLINGVTPVDYAGFVDMVATTDRTQSWI